MSFKIGDMVMVRTDLEIGKIYDRILFVEEKEQYKGMIGTITDHYGEMYLLDICEDWLWSGEMLLLCNNLTKPHGDNVDHPSHYNTGKIEVIDVIEDWNLNFNMGNAVKYVARADHKGKPLEDLNKAKWYIEREIARRNKEEDND